LYPSLKKTLKLAAPSSVTARRELEAPQRGRKRKRYFRVWGRKLVKVQSSQTKRGRENEGRGRTRTGVMESRKSRRGSRNRQYQYRSTVHERVGKEGKREGSESVRGG